MRMSKMNRQRKQRRAADCRRYYAHYFRMAHPEHADAYEAFLAMVQLARLGAGWSRAHLAELVGTTEKGIADFEDGVDCVYGEVYERLKEVLQIRIHCDPTPEEIAKMGDGIGIVVDVSGNSNMLN
jgi:ribosome-binding protein aMBF1 (putative translation factor)